MILKLLSNMIVLPVTHSVKVNPSSKKGVPANPSSKNGVPANPSSKKGVLANPLSEKAVLANPSSKKGVLKSDPELWDYTLVHSAKTQVRFISKHSQKYNPSKWPLRWPYVDIDFYSENARTIWFHHRNILTYSRSIVFPLVSRPFSGIWLDAPHDSVLYVKETYGDLNTCQTGGSRHKTGRASQSMWRSCDSLNEIYPHVKRSLGTQNVSRETLMLENRSLYTVTIGQ